MLHRNLWAPWRMAYLQQLTDAAEGDQPAPTPTCFLCDAGTVEPGTPAAAERLVLDVGEHASVLLNRYPYTNGHVLIAPKAHVASLSDLTPLARAEMMELTARCETLLREAMHCQGLNVGINLGRCAGAGVPGHVHIHVLPRWSGDTNFMATVGQVRVIPQALEESYAYLAQAYQEQGR